jgi:putative tryptophan/tyrosine transport system substrate-binding protein
MGLSSAVTHGILDLILALIEYIDVQLYSRITATGQMRRRAFIAGLTASAIMRPALAQQTGRVYRIAVISPSVPIADLSETGSQPNYRAFFRRLRDLGYIEGQNLAIERYSGEGQRKSYADLAREALRGDPDLIFVVNLRLAREVKTAMKTVPVVVIAGDPAFSGAASATRPSGNVTGVIVDAGVDMAGKSFELLREIVPSASRIAWLASPGLWGSHYGAGKREAAPQTEVSLIGPPLSAPFQEAEYRRVFAAIAKEKAAGLVIGGQSENYAHRRLIVELAEKARLPAIYSYREFVEVGGLMSYGPDLAEIYGHAADQVDQILKGTSPREIPVYHPTKFALVINLRSAKALGLTVPPSLLARADAVIQ